MNGTDNEIIKRIEEAIKDLDLDYMRGLVSEDEYNKKMENLRQQLEAAGGTPPPAISRTAKPASPAAGQPARKAMTDPVTAVKRTIQELRRIPIERIAQESGVDAVNVTKILTDLLDGRELSGRIDHDAGDFILGTGSGPPPKTIAICPYCRAELKRVAVRGETITCPICRESFIVM